MFSANVLLLVLMQHSTCVAMLAHAFYYSLLYGRACSRQKLKEGSCPTGTEGTSESS